MVPKFDKASGETPFREGGKILIIMYEIKRNDDTLRYCQGFSFD